MSVERSGKRISRSVGIVMGIAAAAVVIPVGGASAGTPYSGDTIRNLNSGLCLEIADWGTNDGAIARQWSCTGGANQTWIQSGGTLKNAYSGKCLEIADWGTNDGAIARQWSCTGGANQTWHFGNRANPNSGYDSLMPWVASNANGNKCLEIADWSKDNGAIARQWSCTSGWNQAWGWGSAPIW
ncbi:RICIN domain-containing protein [Kitasatospora sp. NPDC004272]